MCVETNCCVKIFVCNFHFSTIFSCTKSVKIEMFICIWIMDHSQYCVSVLINI